MRFFCLTYGKLGMTTDDITDEFLTIVRNETITNDTISTLRSTLLRPPLITEGRWLMVLLSLLIRKIPCPIIKRVCSTIVSRSRTIRIETVRTIETFPDRFSWRLSLLSPEETMTVCWISVTCWKSTDWIFYFFELLGV